MSRGQVRITEQQRRRLIARRHHLAGDASGPEQVVRSLLALHSTDPASPYLSVLARSRTTRLSDVSEAMYADRTLVRWLAMRRTLFVFDRADIPVVQAAVSTPLAATLRTRLLSRVRRAGTEPPINGDPATWLDDVADAAEAALQQLGTATGAELSRAEPRLATRLLPGAPSDQPQNLTSTLLAMMSAQGRLVRAVPGGSWTVRSHRWEPVEVWWPDGIPALDVATAQRDWARRWLEAFGPATLDDLQWWTGWTKTAVRNATATLPLEEVDLHGLPGVALSDTLDADLSAAQDYSPAATLLPALDPTPMGWKHRDWFMALDRTLVFDRNGNLGPTIWWDGQLVGAWAMTNGGQIRTAIPGDHGTEALTAIAAAAAHLEPRLEGAVVTPVFPTPLERSLRS